MQDLNITLIQSSVEWEQKKANLDCFSDHISGLKEKTDLIVLPEMFNTGFTMNTISNAETEPGETLAWMQRTALKSQAAITGSLIVSEQGMFYNRLYWVNPDGKYYIYDKRHLFRMAEEDKHFSPGSKKRIVEYKGWKFCLMICYDLRFPLWSRNKLDKKNNKPEYDCLIYVANWPKPRREAWSALLKARAIENLAYVAGVNRIGNDDSGKDYSGDSVIISPNGRILAAAEPEKQEIIQQALSYSELENYRAGFPAYLDADSFEIII